MFYLYNSVMDKKYYKERPISFYLGGKDVAAERKAKLEALAEKLDVSASKLVQMLADGEFEYRPKKNKAS